jgi:putative ABC transport system substrate-binding protein
MVDRRSFLYGSALMLSAPRAVDAQQAGKMYRVGGLTVGQPPTDEERTQSAFLITLRRLGWADGDNLTFDDRRSLDVAQLNALAIELVQSKVDVIYTRGTPAARAAKQATSRIPIVMVVGVDPVADGLVASLSRPGGNVTGVTALSSELIGKRLGLIKEVLPRVTSVAYMWNAGNPGNVSAASEMMRVAATMRLRAQPVPVRGPDEFDGAFANMTKERAGALVVGADEMLALHRQRLTTLAARHHIPTMASLLSRNGRPVDSKPQPP